MAPVERASESNGLGCECVSEIQRARILVAMAEVVCERGTGDVSVAHVIGRAGVSRRTFYELFEDREDCFLAAFQEAIGRASRYVSAGYDPTSDWIERVRSALEAILRFLDDESMFGRLAVVESLAAGVRAREMRHLIVARMVAAVDAGRERMGTSSSATALTAEGIVGGVSAVIHGRLISADPGPLVELVNQLMSMIVLPYLGPDAARREMERPVSKISTRPFTATANPLKGLEMRLTYRTVRVLTAVANRPGASNRAIGEAAGVGDQGQISKLLARMEKLSLVENTHTGPSKGAPNAWMLTKQGEEVADVLATRTASS
jgi:AcrR family transcriptional regulator/DNA-binding MarR family transcriptional regulator